MFHYRIGVLYFYFLFSKQVRDSGLPADVLVGKLKKDVSCALRRGAIAKVTAALDAAQRAAEDELALKGRARIARQPLLPPALEKF